MTENHLELFKDLLSVPSQTGREERMVNHLLIYLRSKGYAAYTDRMSNIYVTKGTVGENEYYPCVMAHTDTVHFIKEINVTEVYGKRPPTFGKVFNDETSRLFLTGYDDNGMPSGIGGDDKCGIFLCLRLLEEFDTLKVAFFVSEETGCIGSREADPNFFSDVGYAIQFDAPGNHLVTEVCSGVRLFERNSEFYEICHSTLSSFGEWKYDSHPYTDIKEIKSKFPIACINISCGYYQMHRPVEFIDVDDVEYCLSAGKSLVENLGKRKYDYVAAPSPVYSSFMGKPMSEKKFRKLMKEIDKKMQNGDEMDDDFWNLYWN